MKLFLALNKWLYLIPFVLSFIPVNFFQEVFGILSGLLALLWMFAVSTNGQVLLNDENRSVGNIRFFKLVCGLLPILFLISYTIGKWNLMGYGAFGIIVFISVVISTIFSMLYVYHFTAKTITMIEKKRKVNFNDCFYNMVLIGFSGLGIFFLQPKIQKWMHL